MTKKHLIALATMIKQFNARVDTQGFTPQQIALLADFCSASNPNFMRDRWLGFIKGECGPNGGKV